MSRRPSPGRRRPFAVLVLVALVTAGVLTGAPAAQGAATHRPVIVLDPGHSRTVYAVDERTGLVVSDYENEPEMRDVFAVAKLVAARLRHDGYRVVLTKTRLHQRRTLAQRAAVANRVHAALALSIHDQAGRSGGVGFRAGNNIVYYQSVGAYRSTPSGRHVVFRDKAVAKRSKTYARIFARQRHAVQRATVTSRRNVGYDLGSRGLAGGNMWMVQLLSRVPWIYNEAGGNSRGRVGLTAADRRTYAQALVRSVEACVPVPHRT
ncbi:N-acetylmuramoyl-L-alanine amidase [Jatrophihabitans endophyticus]|uniref:N-acetylmuramoyl-L-alanine amidase n=1 Tax=Jatrophihabitans endophyticus TaxID=1206085 RepID=A0A1M5IWX7_9ACTN|nr:N-acetylmuramoyl-L-alanine amidase [Jatrophihabitans endophyticus]SHG32837.1 N-acetylmuramoyl-L-alanine amidase [Jatrophihabitans endophyticus]